MSERLRSKIDSADDIETFDSKKPPPTDLWVTRTRSRTFTYSAAAYEAMGKPSAIEYRYSPKQRIIGFRPTHRNAPYSYPAYPQHEGSRNFQSAAQAFHNYYDLPVDEAIRYPAWFIDGMLYIDLDDEEAKPVSKAKHARAE